MAMADRPTPRTLTPIFRDGRTSPPPSPPRQPVKGDPELYERIQSHSFDPPGAAFSFAARLARENGWPQSFAERVVAEYRRFVYLACTANHEVTPSEEVDQAWHLHLAYSRNYWEEFCPNVLRRPLHHGPTAGGPAEDARYRENYRRTLALYGETFGVAPPHEIWPPEAIRFGHADEFVRVNKALFSIQPHRWLKSRARGLRSRPSLLSILAGIVLVALLYATITEAMAGSISAFWPIALGFGFAVWLRGIIRSLWRFAAIRNRGGDPAPVFHQPQHGYMVNYVVPIAGVPVIDVVQRTPQGDRSSSSSSGGGGCGGAGVYSGCGGGGGDGGGSGCGGGGCGGGGCGGGG
jgi:hypothetical protein